MAPVSGSTPTWATWTQKDVTRGTWPGSTVTTTLPVVVGEDGRGDVPDPDPCGVHLQGPCHGVADDRVGARPRFGKGHEDLRPFPLHGHGEARAPHRRGAVVHGHA